MGTVLELNDNCYQLRFVVLVSPALTSLHRYVVKRGLPAVPAYQTESGALATVYAQHHGWLKALLLRRLGNDSDAADLAQDAFIRLLLKPRNFDSNSGARAYLSHVAKGLCVDLWRRRSIEQAWLEAQAEVEIPLCPSAEEHHLVLDALCRIDAMLAQLAEPVAQAFVMSQLEGYSYREIAIKLECSERTIKRYMKQAMLQSLLLHAQLEAEL